MHLGLVVPAEQCVTMRVGESSASDGGGVKAWAEGEILFFDDSFEHEVWYPTECGDGVLPRIVLQIVLGHPSL
jgi:hypothetical protein